MKNAFIIATSVVMLSLHSVEARLGRSSEITNNSSHNNNNTQSVEVDAFQNKSDSSINATTIASLQSQRHLTGSQTLKACRESNGGSGCWGDGTHVVTEGWQCAACWRSGYWNGADCASNQWQKGPFWYCGLDPVYGRVNFDVNGWGSTQMHGGDGGAAFNDRLNFESSQFAQDNGFRLTRVDVSSGNHVNYIKAYYSNGRALSHGEDGGYSTSTLNLSEGEYIVSGRICSELITFRFGSGTGPRVVTYVELVTNRGGNVRRGDENGHNGEGSEVSCWNINVGQDNHHVLGFHGRSGDLVDALGTITAPIP